MGYALIWIEGLAAMLLLTALSVSFSARRTRRFRQLALPLLTALAILFLAVTLTYGASILKFDFQRFLTHDWFFYTLSWAIAFAAGVGWLFRRGLKRMGEERIPSALSWPRGRLALAAAGTMILFVITLSNMDLAVKIQLWKARAEAEATLAILEPPAVAENDNAALLYEEAFAVITPSENLPARWKKLLQSWWEWKWRHKWHWNLKGHEETKQRAEDFAWNDKNLRNFLRDQERGLVLLRQASAKGGCHFPRSRFTPWLDWMKWLFPPLTRQAVDASTVLSLDACVQAVDGDPQTALQDVKAILAMARHMPFRAAAGLESTGLNTLVDVLRLCSPSAEQLGSLSLDGMPYLREFPRAEAKFAIFTLVMLSPEQSSRWHWDWSKGVLVSRRGQEFSPGYQSPYWFEATIVPLWRTYLMADDLAFVNSTLKRVQGHIEDRSRPTYANWSQLQYFLDNRPGGLMYVLYIKPKIDNTARWTCEVATLRRLARLAVALASYKAKHGKYADKLEDLTPAFLDRLPKDPWDDGQLHMKRTQEGIVLSTLRNRTVGPAQRGDVVLRLP